MERDTIILDNLSFALFISTQYANMNRHNLDGIQSEAILALCKVAQKLEDKSIDPSDHRAWIVNAVRDAICKFVAHDRILPMDYNTYVKRKRENKLARILNDLQDRTGDNTFDWSTIKPEKDMTRVNELVNVMGLVADEENVIRFILGGDSIAEIADHLKVTTRTISNIKTRIGKKLIKILEKEDGND